MNYQSNANLYSQLFLVFNYFHKRLEEFAPEGRLAKAMSDREYMMAIRKRMGNAVTEANTDKAVFERMGGITLQQMYEKKAKPLVGDQPSEETQDADANE